MHGQYWCDDDYTGESSIMPYIHKNLIDNCSFGGYCLDGVTNFDIVFKRRNSVDYLIDTQGNSDNSAFFCTGTGCDPIYLLVRSRKNIKLPQIAKN